ncbi:MAG: peptidylprolyl isomerase, partial [Oscillospiraceae bacterium]|nr:peptidylprolyl isomerase [Oscillospiraceae bacterium]
MKKILAALLATAVLCTISAGCGGGTISITGQWTGILNGQSVILELKDNNEASFFGTDKTCSYIYDGKNAITLFFDGKIIGHCELDHKKDTMIMTDPESGLSFVFKKGAGSVTAGSSSETTSGSSETTSGGSETTCARSVPVTSGVLPQDIVFTINGEVFTANDYYFQLYMTKRQVLNTSEILTRQFLDQKLGEITVEALLKDSVESALKVSAGVKVVAEENDIALTDGERGEIQKKKDAFIAELGGAGVLRDFLRNNRTSEKALDKYFEINALIDKVENELYSEGKLFDLTAAEVAAAKSEYDTSYARFNYIFFLMVDSSGEALSDRTKQGKRDLATEAAEKAALGENFTNLIKEYSEDASLQEKNGYDTYEVKSDGSDASRASYEDAIFNTAVNGVSGVKDLENGLVIIKRLPLDEGKFENHKSTARKAKLLNDIGEKVKGFFAEPGKEYNNIVIR